MIRISFLLLVTLPILFSTSFAQEAPKVEVFAGYSTLSSDPAGSFNDGGRPQGWLVSGTYNFNRWIGLEAEGSGYYRTERSRLSSFPTIIDFTQKSNNTHSFLVGPRISFRNKSAITPFVHALAGISYLREILTIDEIPLGTPQNGFFGLARAESTFATTKFSTAIGGGFDVRINSRLHWRAVQADYFRNNNSVGSNNSFRFTTGMAIRFGK